MTNINNVDVAIKIIGAFCTSLSVVLAIFELYIRNRSKKAEKIIEMYSNFILIDIMLKSLMTKMNMLKSECDDFRIEDFHSFAKTNMIDKSFISKLQFIENDYLNVCDNSKNQNARDYVLEYIGITLSIFTNINTFYSSILKKKKIETDWFKNKIERLVRYYEECGFIIEQARGELKSKLIDDSDKWNILFIIFMIILLFIIFVSMINK